MNQIQWTRLYCVRTLHFAQEWTNWLIFRSDSIRTNTQTHEIYTNFKKTMCKLTICGSVHTSNLCNMSHLYTSDICNVYTVQCVLWTMSWPIFRSDSILCKYTGAKSIHQLEKVRCVQYVLRTMSWPILCTSVQYVLWTMIWPICVHLVYYTVHLCTFVYICVHCAICALNNDLTHLLIWLRE